MRPRAIGAAGLSLLLTSCALTVGTGSSYVLAPNGMERREQSWRLALEAGAFDSSLARLAPRSKRGAPADELLRSLYQGLIGYYARSYARSASSLQRAYELAEDRFTKSASRGALSLITNDRALLYEPGHTERLLIHYYAILDYLEQDSIEGATVEARRLGHQLARFEESRNEGDASLRAMLHYLSGTVFETAGDSNDADVAYRNAHALAGDSAFPVTALLVSSPAAPEPSHRKSVVRIPPPPPPMGDVVVLIEHGFVAHRVAQRLTIAVGEAEARGLRGKKREMRGQSALSISERVLLEAASAEDGGICVGSSAPPARRFWTGGAMDSSMHVLTLSWPVYRRPRHSTVTPSVLVDAAERAPVLMRADLSDAVAGDYRRERAQILARAVARASAKMVLAREAEKAAEKKCDGCGWLAKLGVRSMGNAFERADLRSWHLLPGEIGIVRLRLPAGKHTLTLEVAGDPWLAAMQLPIGEVEVRAGAIAFRTQRIWHDASGAGLAGPPVAEHAPR